MDDLQLLYLITGGSKHSFWGPQLWCLRLPIPLGTQSSWSGAGLETGWTGLDTGIHPWLPVTQYLWLYGDLMVISWCFNGISWWFNGDLMGFHGDLMVI